MLAECTRRFLDRDAGVIREAGDRFEVTPSRFEEINATQYGTLVVKVEEQTAGNEEPKRPAKRQGRRKPRTE